MQDKNEKLIIIIEDARGIRTWQTLIDIVTQCACRTSKTNIEIKTAKGPLEGLRVSKIIRALHNRDPHAIIVVAPDTDRYGCAKETEERLNDVLERCCRDALSSIKILPFIEKLEDWVYTLLEGESCRCCGAERLARVLGGKYEKYMMAKRIPSKLRSSRDKVCENLSKRWLLSSTGLDRLLGLLCVQ